MCGIAGIFYFDAQRDKKFNQFTSVLEKLKHRGPDHQNYLVAKNCVLFHTRLSILDVTEASNQPFVKNNKYLTYNGELFNYKTLKQNLKNINSTGDVEVLHALLDDNNDPSVLNKLNGFFAFAFYDDIKNELLLGRDRLGIKPLYYYKDDEKFAFASELKPLLEMVGKQELNLNQLHAYFRLNYCAGNESIFKNIHQLEAGHFIKITSKTLEKNNWYRVEKKEHTEDLYELLNSSVQLRLHADVPVGCFLSGGLDSSIISALAKQQHSNIHTFSIGFKDEPYFDETNHARLVAKHIHSSHHEFKLSNADFLENIHPFLNSIDEPFADSSALNFYMLSKLTKEHVKVALSGDGADELFKGYNKHRALTLASSFSGKLLTRLTYPAVSLLPQSRQGWLHNKARQISKLKQLIGLSEAEKQKFLAQLSSESEVNLLLKAKTSSSYFNSLFYTDMLYKSFELVDTFDLQTVLKDDMLVKADRFSMQHGLEIRNPFLDHRIVEFALNLNEKEKTDQNKQKIILKRKFEALLPKQIVERTKKGFELPLWKWLNNELKTEINDRWLNKIFIEEQNIFNYTAVEKLKSQLFSKNPGDSAAKVWALLVFQNWYLKNKNYIS